VLSRALPLLSRQATEQWLLDVLRLDPHLLGQLDLSDLRACLASGFKRRQLGTLLAVLETLQQELVP
jgi:hypothetical protein